MDFGNRAERFSDVCKSYKLDAESVVLILSHPCSVYFWGVVDFEIIWGAVTMLGYERTKTTNRVTIYSPKGTALIDISTVTHNQPFDQRDFPQKLEENPDFMRECKMTNNTTIVLLTKNKKTKTMVELFTRFLDYRIFPQTDHVKTENERIVECQFESLTIQNNLFRIPETWKILERDILGDHCSPNSSKPVRVVICGGQNRGKSTLLRYLVNRAFSRNPSKFVLVLDFDPGQSEFTIMGSVSAVIIDRPILSLACTTSYEPVRSLYLGTVNVFDCLDTYVHLVRSLCDYAKSIEIFRSVPWFINTMGLRTEIGADVISQIIKHVEPTDVIEIKSKRDNYNFPHDLTIDYVRKYHPSMPLNNDYIYHSIPSASDDLLNTSKGCFSNPINKRSAMVASYLVKMLTTELQLTDPKPVWYTKFTIFISIDLSNAEIFLSGIDDTENQFVSYEIINNNFVTLCYKDDTDVKHILGHGFVRCIDPSTNRAYIISPISKEEIENANLIAYSPKINISNFSFISCNVEIDQQFAPYTCSHRRQT